MFNAEILSWIMDWIYHDWSFRLRYSVTSKTNNQAFISDKRLVRGKTVNVRKDSLVATLQMNRLVSDAARLALKSISNVPWTAEDPKCALQHCRYDGKTGKWIPRHVKRDEASIVETMWWHNGATTWMDCMRSDPQDTVEESIEYMLNRIEAESVYVVCCMACGEELQKALRTVHIDGEQNFEIILGVDRIIFPGEEHDIILIE